MNGQDFSGSPFIVDPSTNRIVAIRHPDGSTSSLSFGGTNTPTLIASVGEDAAIPPYSLVTTIQGDVPFHVTLPYNYSAPCIGVSSGDINQAGYNAFSGERVRMQDSDFVQVTCSEDYEVAAGDLLAAEAYSGRVIPATTAATLMPANTPNNPILRALQDATYGQVFWAQKIGGWSTASGGGAAPFTGGVSVETWTTVSSGTAQTTYFPPSGWFMLDITCVGGGMNGQAGAGLTPGRGGSGGRIARRVLTPADMGGATSLQVQAGNRTAYTAGMAYDGQSWVKTPNTSWALLSAFGAGNPVRNDYGGSIDQAMLAANSSTGWSTNAANFYGSGGDVAGWSGRFGNAVTGPGGGAGGSSTTAASAGAHNGCWWGGNSIGVWGSQGGTAGTSGGGSGGAGSDASMMLYNCGSAGGGGGYNSAGAGGVGGAGGYGAGGGGGGGGTGGGGVGGLGGIGIVIIRATKFTS